MINKIKNYLILNNAIYWSVYLIKTFCIWEFTNPFQWIIDIPIEDFEYRLMLVCAIPLYQLFISMCLMFYYEHKEEKERRKEI